MKRPAYLTIEEMRTLNQKSASGEVDADTRFQGTTDPTIAIRYFPDRASPILECGPHTGGFAKKLLEAGYKHLYAVDFYDALQLVKPESIHLQIRDLNTERLPYEDNFFAGATAWGIGEHMENPFFFMREVHRVLKPGGIFIFALPNIFHIISRLIFLKTGDFPRWRPSNNHIMMFSKATFRKTFLRYFIPLEIIYTKPGFDHPILKFVNRFLPSNEWFGNYVVYVLKKKERTIRPS